jgi:hypothetical protein
LGLLVRYEPGPYVEAAVPPGPSRKTLADDFTREFFQLLSSITDSRDEPWGAHFREDQINSYFAETFVNSGLQERLLPEGVSQPRVVIEPGLIRLAFRYGSGVWTTVISIDLKVWLAQDEPNVVALQVVGFRAGALPISAQKLFETVAELGRHNGINIDWYRYDGQPVALLRFHNDLSHPSFELDELHLEAGALTIQGRCTDGSPARAQLSAKDPLQQTD